MERLTHASFFSGVGGLDLGLERAGWRTVSFSEIDPYASAVLAQRWPGVPNLGDITRIRAEPAGRVADERRGDAADDGRRQAGGGLLGSAATATLWSGGFPCQDLSVAGKRRGMGEGTRSGLAFAFLDLVERHRPPAVLLENVPGLLSSHGGRDMAALVGRLVELGYGVGYRVLDARYFGVPQRRRRVFIVGLTPGGRAGAEFAAEVLSVGSRCRRHPPTGVEAGEGAAVGTGVGVNRPGYDISHALSVSNTTGRLDSNGETFRVERTSPDSRRVRAPDGLAGRMDDRGGLAPTLNSNKTGGWRYDADQVEMLTMAGAVADDPLLPLGLDSHRYRCCGNGVVSDVAEWIGRQLIAALERVA